MLVKKKEFLDSRKYRRNINGVLESFSITIFFENLYNCKEKIDISINQIS